MSSLTLGLLVAPAEATVSPAAAIAGDSRDRDDEATKERPDVWSARLAARVQGSRVEVTGARSAVSRTWANPDGSLTSEGFTGPSWTRDSSGAWVEIDTTLVTDGKGVRPRAAAVQVDLSGGAAAAEKGVSAVARVAVPREALADLAAATRTGELARVPVGTSAGERWAGFEIGWPGALPEPELAGASATYRRVAPGQDLRVKVVPTGVETFVDLTEPSAKVPENGVAVVLPVTSTGLTITENGEGGLRLRDAKTGADVGAGGAARIWDASIDERSGDPRHSTVVDTRVRKTAAGVELVVVVPREFLATEGLVWPVTVDPSMTLGPGKDAYVEKGYDSSNFGTEDDLKVGTYDGGTHIARSYINFPLGDGANFYNANTVVDSAKLMLYEWHAASCTKSVMEVRRATSAWTETGVTWNNKPSQSGVLVSVNDAHKQGGGGV